MSTELNNNQNMGMEKCIKIAYYVIDSWDELEIIDLYRAGGWWDVGQNSQEIAKLIQGSFIFMIAFDICTNKAIGMGRIISDGFSDGYIQDVAVLYNYREHGIGTMIATILRSLGLALGLSWIGLISAPGKENIYKRAGFFPMEKYTPMNIDGI